MSAQRVVLELQPDAFLPLRNLKGARVACLEGVLWITHDGDPNDILLQPGQAYKLGRSTATVQAIGASRMAIDEAQHRIPIRALTPISASQAPSTMRKSRSTASPSTLSAAW